MISCNYFGSADSSFYIFNASLETLATWKLFYAKFGEQILSVLWRHEFWRLEKNWGSNWPFCKVVYVASQNTIIFLRKEFLTNFDHCKAMNSSDTEYSTAKLWDLEWTKNHVVNETRLYTVSYSHHSYTKGSKPGQSYQKSTEKEIASVTAKAGDDDDDDDNNFIVFPPEAVERLINIPGRWIILSSLFTNRDWIFHQS